MNAKQMIERIETLSTADAAAVLLAGLQRLGQQGREGAEALAELVADGDADFDEAAEWIDAIASGDAHELGTYVREA